MIVLRQRIPKVNHASWPIVQTWYGLLELDLARCVPLVLRGRLL